MRILVTGGAGFIGSHVTDAFLEAGHDVSIVDNLSTGNPAWVHPRARLHAVDLRSAQLASVFERERPEVVAHLAAQAAVSRSVLDPGFDASVNVMGGLRLLECCRRFGVRRLIYSSSGGAGYGDTETIPTPETHPSQPASPYGVSKVAFELYLAAWGSIHAMSGVSLRYANIYGPRQNPVGEAGVVAIFCHRILTGGTPAINGDGEQTRDFVYVGDVAAANVRALGCAEVTGPVNIGTGIETSVNTLYRHLTRAAGTTQPAERAPARPGEQRRSCLDPALAARRLGWRPEVSLGEGLQRTYDFFKRELGEAKDQP
ncbi:MAG TPA: NAD-dependent epimerase/dehydratase family protein [Candidatus Binatia bacterium]|nr:NAD-dependent epimerase/dehydratase family protein [Candidatus Binatia bacterium]